MNRQVIDEVTSIFEDIAARLKWSNQRRETVVSTIYNHMRADSPIREADNASKTSLPGGLYK
jgi:hypothetical protein